MSPRARGSGTRLGTAATTLALTGALLGIGWTSRSQADPDFPTIPPRNTIDAQQPQTDQQDPPAQDPPAQDPSAPDSSVSAAETNPAQAQGLASAHDCVSIKYAVGRVAVLANGQVDVSQRFASKDEGQQAVDKDLEALNQIQLYLVYAETGVEDPAQRAKITAYKDALGQVSVVMGERRDQDMTKPAAYDWAGRLSQAQAHANSALLDVGNSCLV